MLVTVGSLASFSLGSGAMGFHVTVHAFRHAPAADHRSRNLAFIRKTWEWELPAESLVTLTCFFIKRVPYREAFQRAVRLIPCKELRPRKRHYYAWSALSLFPTNFRPNPYIILTSKVRRDEFSLYAISATTCFSEFFDDST